MAADDDLNTSSSRPIMRVAPASSDPRRDGGGDAAKPNGVRAKVRAGRRASSAPVAPVADPLADVPLAPPSGPAIGTTSASDALLATPSLPPIITASPEPAAPDPAPAIVPGRPLGPIVLAPIDDLPEPGPLAEIGRTGHVVDPVEVVPAVIDPVMPPLPGPAPVAPAPAVDADAETTDDAPPRGLLFRRRRHRVRRVTRVVRHVDTWSVFKIALVFNVVLYVVCLTAGVLLWNVAYSTGTVDNVQKFFEQFGWSKFTFKGGQIYHAAWIAGLFVTVGLTGFAVLLTTLFNLITDLVGGVRVTVLEEEVVATSRTITAERPPRRARHRTSKVPVISNVPDGGDGAAVTESEPAFDLPTEAGGDAFAVGFADDAQPSSWLAGP